MTATEVPERWADMGMDALGLRSLRDGYTRTLVTAALHAVLADVRRQVKALQVDAARQSAAAFDGGAVTRSLAADSRAEAFGRVLDLLDTGGSDD